MKFFKITVEFRGDIKHKVLAQAEDVDKAKKLADKYLQQEFNPDVYGAYRICSISETEISKVVAEPNGNIRTIPV